MAEGRRGSAAVGAPATQEPEPLLRAHGTPRTLRGAAGPELCAPPVAGARRVHRGTSVRVTTRGRALYLTCRLVRKPAAVLLEVSVNM
ncbi:hypothetical protein AGIG_G10323 [Arapaima gigas]